MDLHKHPNWAHPGQLFTLNPDGDQPPVLLTHGTFSDASTCVPLASFLADQGHPVHIIEWRGRGGNPGQFTFHDLAEGEIAGALHQLAGHEPLHLVAHSGGGLAMCFAALAHRPRLASLTLLATQSTHLTNAPRAAYAGIRAIDALGWALGYWPTRLLKLGPCNESAALLRQWLVFNRNGHITDRAGDDIFPQLATLNLPVLALAGAADTVIARSEGCFALARAFGSTSRTHLCKSATDGEDFTHARLFKSRAAARYVWPRIYDFISG